MIAIREDPFLLLAILSSLGVLPGLLLWSMPRVLKVWVLLVTGGNLLILLWIAEGLTRPAAEISLVFLLSLAALLTVLGQNPKKGSGAVLLLTLILLALGLGSMAGDARLGQVFLIGLLFLLGLLIFHYRKLSGLRLWWGIGMYGFGIACILVSLVSSLPTSNVALLLTLVVLLPLFPFHGGYVAALAGLPGTLPAFIAVLLPVLGFHGMLTLIPELAPEILRAVVFLALSGALYASLKALIQFRVVYLLIYASLAFFAILWWYLASTGIYTPQATVYFSAVVLVTSGFFLAWHSVQVRYGDLDLDRIGGLARPMPRFATLLSLLVMAATGLPPFGLFSGYMEMLLSPTLTLSADLIVILLTWLMASWYFLRLMQRILFGQPRPHILYEDLRHTEVASILIVLLILAAIGITPYGFLRV